MIDHTYPSDNPPKTTVLSWQDEPNNRELNDFRKDHSLFLQDSNQTKQQENDAIKSTLITQTKEQRMKPIMSRLLKEDIQTLSYQDFQLLQKNKIKYINTLSLGSSYIPEGFCHTPLGSAFSNIKYCSKVDFHSFLSKRIKGKNFLKMRKAILHSMRTATKFLRADLELDKTLVLNPSLKSLTQSSPDHFVQRGMECLILDTLFPYERKQLVQKKQKKVINRTVDKLLQSETLQTLTVRKESVKNLLTRQTEIAAVLERLPNLREFTLGIDLGYKTFWSPQLGADIASRITSFNMRYKSSHAMESKSPLFDFLDNIEAFKNLKSFRYEESDGIHWTSSEDLKEMTRLKNFKSIPLEKLFMNFIFGTQTPTVERAIRGFFKHLELPPSLQSFTFYGRFDNISIFGPIQESFPSFKSIEQLENLKNFDLGLIVNTLVTHATAKEEEIEMLFQFFKNTIAQLNTGLEDLSLTIIKNAASPVERKYYDEELLAAINERFQALKTLSFEFPDRTVELLVPDLPTLLPKLEKIAFAGCSLPLSLCEKLNPNTFRELSYTGPKTIELQTLVDYFEGVSNLRFLSRVELLFPGYDKYAMRKEILEGIFKILQQLKDLTEFNIFIDVRVPTRIVDWLLNLANEKEKLKYCKFYFHRCGAFKPSLKTKEDFGIKHYLEKSRKFLLI